MSDRPSTPHRLDELLDRLAAAWICDDNRTAKSLMSDCADAIRDLRSELAAQRELLDQHDSYRFGEQITVIRSMGLGRLWRIFLRGDNRHPDAGPYDSLAEACAVAGNLANQARWRAEGRITKEITP